MPSAIPGFTIDELIHPQWPSHTWLCIFGLHYDAEGTLARENWRDLPIFEGCTIPDDVEPLVSSPEDTY